MALHTKKLRYQRGGTTHVIDLYTSTAEVGSECIALRDGSTTVYAALGDTTDSYASHIRLQRSGATKAVLSTLAAPTWQWAVKAGGISYDQGRGIAVDSFGNCYIAGYFSGTATFGVINLISAGGYDIFIAKLNNAGAWQWAAKAGGTANDLSLALAVDSSENCYITGYFNGTATFGTTNLTSTGSEEIFVAKLNSAGAWQWAVKAGSANGSDRGNAITVDSSGNSYITGYFSGSATFGTINLASAGYSMFVAKLNTLGTWQWAIKADGTAFIPSNAIGMDSSGNCYVAGYFSNTATFGTTNLTSTDFFYDVFVAKVNNTGAWEWAIRAGNTSYDQGYGIAVDSSGNSYITGSFRETATFGTVTLTSAGDNDIFVAKLNNTGAWQWAVRAGGTLADSGYAIAVDASGNSYITGDFSGTATFGTINLTSAGTIDMFVAKLNNVGAWQWALRTGGSADDRGRAITVDMSGNCYIAGEFSGTATFGTTNLTSAGYLDVFVAKYGR